MHRPFSFAVLLLAAAPLAAQSQPPQPQTETRGLEQPSPAEGTTHDITQVERAPLGGAISIPMPERGRKKSDKNDIPELDGTMQAVGSQRIDGRLPKPLVDYTVSTAAVFQRLSIFEGGLVVIDSRGVGGPISKKVLIPGDVLKNYLRVISPASLAAVHNDDLRKPRDTRKALIRVYDQQSFVERQFDPMATLPKTLSDQVTLMQDLLRAIYQDRTVTNSVALYMPKAGDELVGDDKRIYKVTRVMNGKLVELHCLSQPTILYVDVKDLYNYFIGTPGAASR